MTDNTANDSGKADDKIYEVDVDLACPTCGDHVCKPAGTEYFSCGSGHTFGLADFLAEQRIRAHFLCQASCKLLEQQAALFRKLAEGHGQVRGAKLDLEDIGMMARFHRAAENAMDVVGIMKALWENFRQ